MFLPAQRPHATSIEALAVTIDTLVCASVHDARAAPCTPRPLPTLLGILFPQRLRCTRQQRANSCLNFGQNVSIPLDFIGRFRQTSQKRLKTVVPDRSGLCHTAPVVSHPCASGRAGKSQIWSPSAIRGPFWPVSSLARGNSDGPLPYSFLWMHVYGATSPWY